MTLSKRKKIAGLVLAAVLVMFAALVAFVAFMGYVGSDALSSQATGSELLKPDEIATGKALVVYNPGLSGAPKDAATRIASDLAARGYEVMLAGVKSEAAANVSGYDVIVAGGPIYGGKVSRSIESYLQALTPPDTAKVGAFAIGSSNGKPFPDVVWLKVIALFSPGNDMDQQQAEFVADLLE